MDPCDQTIPNYYQPSANYSQTTYRRNWSDLRNSPFNAYNISSLSPSSNYPGLIVDHEIRARYTAVGPPSAAAQAAAAEMRAQQANQTVGRRRRRRCPPSYGNYATMIAHEILQSPRRKMTLRQIYHHLEARFPDMFSDERPGEVGGKGWQNTVRHSLSINSCFVKIPRNKDDDTDSEEDTDYYVSSDGRMTPRSTKRPSAGYKKGGYWAVDESHLSTISHNGKLDLRRIAATKPGQSHPYAMI
ncbi:Forkhead box protein J3 [Neolecta irregularis DAH-3]|uniref:Forkhead box protein J3 n=1 Tax=Neolecta irregularis (strain DAH-3) TaxID=1198029 RepID=A0A1U7LJ82_NEOID|nr:Forkhead box protein J3 [Neolecta irregularis DAH-3]|eukprot:OLL22704.1 Forkhead box protein J3 [Neolecta irregularis DAH-3]